MRTSFQSDERTLFKRPNQNQMFLFLFSSTNHDGDWFHPPQGNLLCNVAFSVALPRSNQIPTGCETRFSPKLCISPETWYAIFQGLRILPNALILDLCPALG